MTKTSSFKTLREYVEAQVAPRRKTQGQIAKELGITDSALSVYLSGRRLPSRDVAIRLSKLCGIPLESLFTPPEADQTTEEG